MLETTDAQIHTFDVGKSCSLGFPPLPCGVTRTTPMRGHRRFLKISVCLLGVIQTFPKHACTQAGAEQERRATVTAG